MLVRLRDEPDDNIFTRSITMARSSRLFDMSPTNSGMRRTCNVGERLRRLLSEPLKDSNKDLAVSRQDL
jgi:hypothetical protein